MNLPTGAVIRANRDLIVSRSVGGGDGGTVRREEVVGVEREVGESVLLLEEFYREP